jgi:hypothetical protein
MLHQTLKAPRMARGLAMQGGISVLLLFAAVKANAQSDTLYETSRILEHNGLECSGAPACKSVEAGRHRISAGATRTITVQCPPALPYLVAWDSEQNETISAVVRSRPKLPASREHAPSDPDSRLVIAAANDGSSPGHITLFLGCATTPVAPAAGVMRQRSAVPSNAPTYLGGN